MGIGLFSLVEERLEVVNYTQFLGADTFTLLMKNIKRVSKVESIVAPFNLWVIVNRVILSITNSRKLDSVTTISAYSNIVFLLYKYIEIL